MNPITTCTHRSCVCVYFGGGRCVSPSATETRKRRYSRRGGRLHFRPAERLRQLSLCCCSVCIHYNYIHTYIRETYGVCNRSVHTEMAGGVAG